MSIRGSRTVGMTRLVFFTLLVVSQIIALACCAEIDPKVYARVFEVNQPAWDKLTDLIEAKVPAGSTVIDIGAGPGEPSKTMATRLSQHKFVVTDKQQPMLDKAKVRLEGLSNVDIQQASAEDLSAFPSNTYDAATGCYVLMFVDVHKALAETARVLKPGGLAFFSVWNEVALYSITREALGLLYTRKGYKGDPPDTPVNPMALSPTTPALARSTLEKELAAMSPAPLKVIAEEDIAYDMVIGTIDEVCPVSFMLATPFDKIAEANGVAEADVKAEYCIIFQELFSARASLANVKDGSAKIYTLEKLPEREL